MDTKTNQTGINFSALGQLKSTIGFSFQIITIAAMIACGLLLAMGFEWAAALLFLLFWVLFFSIAVLAYRTHQLKVENKAVLRQFAADNGFTYSDSHPDPLYVRKGTLFEHGHSQQASQFINGLFYGLPFSHYQYEYSVGSGKNRRSYTTTVFEVVLPRALPHMVIDSLVESGNGNSSTLPIKFNPEQKIDLEGDFYKYFSLYAPDSYGVSALTILAPDAMEALMRHAALCDIEIIADRLYFYWPGQPRNQNEYQDVYETVMEVWKEIGNKLAKGDIFTRDSHKTVHSGAGQLPVRLKSGGLDLITVVFILVPMGLFALSFVSNGHQPALFVYVLLSALVVPYFRNRQRTAKREELARRFGQA